MHLRQYNPNDRYKQRSMERLAAIGVILLVMLFSVFTGFYFGKERALRENILLKSKLENISVERDELQAVVTELRTEARTATLRYEELQQTYEAAVPEGPVRELTALVSKQLAEGMSPERLGFLIRSARPPRNCTDPETQRFIVSTPLYTGTESLANIGQGAIKIKASGTSARNDKGDREAWYDASKSVDIEFILRDGTVEKKQGVMPISHSLVAEGREYRFTVAEGARSFAKVSFDSCDYP